MEKRSLLTRIEKPKNEKLGKTYIINQTKKFQKQKKYKVKVFPQFKWIQV